jgi:hypothetical protein
MQRLLEPAKPTASTMTNAELLAECVIRKAPFEIIFNQVLGPSRRRSFVPPSPSPEVAARQSRLRRATQPRRGGQARAPLNAPDAATVSARSLTGRCIAIVSAGTVTKRATASLGIGSVSSLNSCGRRRRLSCALSHRALARSGRSWGQRAGWTNRRAIADLHFQEKHAPPPGTTASAVVADLCGPIAFS